MKNLDLVSFVGVDIHTNLDELEKFQSPINCEWSVLYSDSKSLTKDARYPSLQFCKDFLDWGAEKYINTSIHLCGSVIERYLNKESDVLDLCKNAQRIQLNINIKNYPDHVKLSERIWSLQKNYGHSIILQQNKTKAAFMKVFLEMNICPMSILHDGSGGFGREITVIQPPDEKEFTGYAGGIKPENVAKIVDLIEKNNPNNKKYYIDMESGVRTDNIFSLEKCRQVIQNLTVVE